MRGAVLLLLLSSVVLSEDADNANKKSELVYIPVTRPDADIYLFETFTDQEQFDLKWVRSEATKDGADADIAKYDGEWAVTGPTVGGFSEEQGLVMQSSAKHYAISTKLERPFVFDEHYYFVIQYDVNFQEGLTCGGAYVKLLSKTDSLDLEQFHEKTPYTIMFGPDRCGTEAKVHFIFRHKNPVTGVYEEHHAKAVDTPKEFFDDKKTHLFRLQIKADNTYDIVIDDTVASSGSLLHDFQPPVNPPEEIDDPDDKRPEDWDEQEKIADPTAVKPDDWDEDAPAKISNADAVKPEGWLDEGPDNIPDPDADQPDDWDEEEDGEWEAPSIPNPVCEEVGCGEWQRPMIANLAYKGKWSAPMIANPDYQGTWKPQRIPNPGYFVDDNPFNLTSVEALGLELWTMSKDIIFDNFIVTSELTAASYVAQAGWRRKMEHERESDPGSYLGSFLEWFVTVANERPYLWLLYVVVLVMPFVLCAACCVRSKPAKLPTGATDDTDASRKKTDAVSPDDQPDAPSDRPLLPEPSFVASAEDEEEEEQKEKDMKPEDNDDTAEDKSGTDSRPASRESVHEKEVVEDNSQADEQLEEDEQAAEPKSSPGKAKKRKNAARRET